MHGFADRSVAAVLFAVHVGLLVWAAAGFAEMAWTDQPWPRVSNPLFSEAMLFLQWSVVAGAAATFCIGYARRWAGLPGAMTAWYAVMAAICAWQTFLILEHSARFVLMALEYAAYVAIALYLHLSPHMRGRAG